MVVVVVGGGVVVVGVAAVLWLCWWWCCGHDIGVVVVGLMFVLCLTSCFVAVANIVVSTAAASGAVLVVVLVLVSWCRGVVGSENGAGSTGKDTKMVKPAKSPTPLTEGNMPQIMKGLSCV